MSKQINIGIIGCGAISNAYFTGCKPYQNVKLVACADIDPVRAAAKAKEHGIRACSVAELLADPGIIRNRLKVDAIIDNAQRVQRLRASHGSFAAWLDAHHPRDKAGWVKLFKQTFRFTGGEIVGEFLMSLGYLPNAHAPDCDVAREIATLAPPWMQG